MIDDRYDETSPDDLPISLEEAKSFLRVDTSADDDVIKALLGAVTNQGEKFTNRLFVQRAVTGSFSGAEVSDCERYPFIQIRRAPLISLTSFQSEVDGVLTDISTDDYQLKKSNGFSRILITESITFDDVPFPLQAVFQAGYGAAKDVPDDIKTALKMHLNFMYENRGDVAPEGKISMPLEVKSIYGKYRIVNTF